jgi:hypothetical protein
MTWTFVAPYSRASASEPAWQTTASAAASAERKRPTRVADSVTAPFSRL